METIVIFTATTLNVYWCALGFIIHFFLIFTHKIVYSFCVCVSGFQLKRDKNLQSAGSKRTSVWAVFWIHHIVFQICQKFVAVRVCGYISVNERLFWQWVRQLHFPACGSHPWDCDVFDTMRLSDQNTPPLRHIVKKRASFFFGVCFCLWRRSVLEDVSWWAQSDMTGASSRTSLKQVNSRWRN